MYLYLYLGLLPPRGWSGSSQAFCTGLLVLQLLFQVGRLGWSGHGARRNAEGIKRGKTYNHDRKRQRGATHGGEGRQERERERQRWGEGGGGGRNIGNHGVAGR